MKRYLFLAIAILAAHSCYAQQTSVAATIVDPNGFAYQFLTGSASINCPGNQAPLYNGFSVPRNYPITGGDGNGHFTLGAAVCATPPTNLSVTYALQSVLNP